MPCSTVRLSSILENVDKYVHLGQLEITSLRFEKEMKRRYETYLECICKHTKLSERMPQVLSKKK